MHMYGQMAQTVAPNPKCESCLHYNSQRGASGVCEIGLRPITCGDGDMPSMGYAPVASIGPDTAGTHSPNGQAPIQPGKHKVPTAATHSRNGGQLEVVAMQVHALGEEHVEMVKSIAREYSTVCRQHDRTASMVPSASALNPTGCACRRASDAVVARAFAKSLTNRERHTLGDELDRITQTFVVGVRAGDSVDSVQKSLIHEAVEKGFYGQEWIDQFKHTDLFDDAIALCEEEIAIAEDNIKRRIEMRKRQMEREAHLAKLGKDPMYDYDDVYQKEEAIRLKKRKLEIKLAKMQQKTASKTVSKGHSPEDTASGTKQFKAAHGTYKIESMPHQHTLSYQSNDKMRKEQSLGVHSTVQQARTAAGKHHDQMAKPSSAKKV